MNFDSCIVNIIAKYLPMRDRAMVREVATSWRNAIFDIKPEGVVKDNSLRNILIKASGQNYLSKEDEDIIAPYGIPIPRRFDQVIRNRCESLRKVSSTSTARDLMFLRYTLLLNLHEKYVQWWLGTPSYLSWYIALTKHEKIMCMKLPSILRDKIRHHYKVTDLDIYLYDRLYMRMIQPWDSDPSFKRRHIIYEFSLHNMREGDFILYLGYDDPSLAHLAYNEQGCKDISMLPIHVYLFHNEASLNLKLETIHENCDYDLLKIGQYVGRRIINVTSQYNISIPLCMKGLQAYIIHMGVENILSCTQYCVQQYPYPIITVSSGNGALEGLIKLSLKNTKLISINKLQYQYKILPSDYSSTKNLTEREPEYINNCILFMYGIENFKVVQLLRPKIIVTILHDGEPYSDLYQWVYKNPYRILRSQSYDCKKWGRYNIVAVDNNEQLEDPQLLNIHI